MPRDCCAARTAREHKQALEHIGAMADARVVLSSSLRLEKPMAEKSTTPEEGLRPPAA